MPTRGVATNNFGLLLLLLLLEFGDSVVSFVEGLSLCALGFCHKNEFIGGLNSETPLKRPCGSCGTWWRINRVDVFRPDGRGFESHSKRHVGTLGKSFTCSCP